MSSILSAILHYDFQENLRTFFIAGNNIYGEDVATAVRKLRQEESGAGLAAYILMQRIFPALNKSYLIRDGVWRTEKTISELGIFSTYLR